MNKLIKFGKVLKNPLFLKAFVKYKVAAGVEHSGLPNYIRLETIRTIVDIGANCGQFALAARNCFPSAEIVSFEPLKEPAILFRHVFANDARTTLHEIAIGPHEVELPIHVSQKNDSSSLLPITDLQIRLFPGTSEKEIRKVMVKPLSSLLSANEIEMPAILKIDVQGFEKQVLQGCVTLLDCFSYVYIECSFVELYQGQSLAYEIIAFLAEHGFFLHGVYNMYFDRTGIALQGDFLFGSKLTRK